MREPVRTGQVAESPSTKEAWAELWRYRAVVLPLLIGMVLAETGLGATYVWAAPALARGFALPPDRIGAIMATGLMLSGVLGPILGGFLADRCQRTGGARRTISALSAITLLTIPTGLFAFAPGIPLASVLLVVFVVIVTAVLVIGMALFTVVIPNELRGLSVALLFAAETLVGVALAPMTVSLLSGAIGGPPMIGKALSIVCVVVGALASVAFGCGRRSVSGQALE
jgi:MFS family permease